MTQDKVTIQEAARTMDINRRKIYRMIEKGLISKYIEDGKTFVILEELKAICAERATENAQERTAHNERTNKNAQVNTTERTHYTVDKEHYEGLLIRLGQMESEKRYLLEYKTGLEQRDKELAEARATLAKANNELKRLVDYKQDAERNRAELEAKEKELAEIRAENDRLKLPFWRRWFGK